MTNISAPTLPASRPLLRFLRTPKGLLLIIFVGLTAVSYLTLGDDLVVSKVTAAAATAAAIDMALTYLRRRQWILPDGAILTGMIVAFILRPQEGWLILAVTVAVAILSKHVLRTRWSNILNPAAFALVIAAIALHADQSWWGALPNLGIIGALILVAAGGVIADRINKLPMILAFLGAYFTLFTVASIFRSTTVAETFLTPDLQAALFFAFFMLDEPPTCPVRHEDQIVFGIIVAVVAYFTFMQFGGVYFLPAGLLAGNLWESGRRLVVSHVRTRPNAPAEVYGLHRFRVASGLGTAAVAVPLVFASCIFATSGPVAASGTTDSYPFVSSFHSEFKGTYTQTLDATDGHLVLNGLATGDVSLGVHVELLQSSVEASPDDEGLGTRPEVTTTINTAQLLGPSSNDLLCDGKLTALGGETLRFNCDGMAAYVGVEMQIASQVIAAPDGTFTAR